MPDYFTIFLHSGAYDRIYQAVNMLLAASSSGHRCRLFLFYQALAAYVADAWDRTEVGAAGAAGSVPEWDKNVARAFELANAPSLYRVLDMARNENGGVSVYACSASVRILGLDPAEVKKKVDEIVGLSTMLELASHGGPVLYI